MQPTYEELLADNQRLRTLLASKQQQMLADLIDSLLADDAPLVRAKAEAYEYRIYELEIEYMLLPAGQGQAVWDSCEHVKANYARDYPDRPLRPKPRPSEHPAPTQAMPPWPVKKDRKPYTRKAKPVAPSPTVTP